MSNTDHVLEQGAIPSPTSSPTAKTSSMPDIKRYTARLKKISDKVPKRPAPVIFTGASSSKMNRRVKRLTPPKGKVFRTPPSTENPGYYGSDARKYEKRTSRYVDGKPVGSKRGGPPVFSGSSEMAYEARLMRLQDKH